MGRPFDVENPGVGVVYSVDSSGNMFAKGNTVIQGNLTVNGTINGGTGTTVASVATFGTVFAQAYTGQNASPAYQQGAAYNTGSVAIASGTTGFTPSPTVAYYLCGASATATASVVLPSTTAVPGQFWGFKKIDTGTQPVLLVGSGSEVIDAHATLSLGTQFWFANLVATPGTWMVVGSGGI